MYNIPNLKFKTTLCEKWRSGEPCDKAPNCYFAHGEAQLRKIQEIAQNQQLIASRNQSFLQSQSHNNCKTVYCKFYAKGQCKLGASCTFAHQRKQKRKITNQNIPQPPPISPYPIYNNMGYYYPSYQFLYGQNYNQEIHYYLANQQYLTNSNQNVYYQQSDELKKKKSLEERSTDEKQNSQIENLQKEISQLNIQDQ